MKIQTIKYESSQLNLAFGKNFYPKDWVNCIGLAGSCSYRKQHLSVFDRRAAALLFARGWNTRSKHFSKGWGKWPRFMGNITRVLSESPFCVNANSDLALLPIDRPLSSGYNAVLSLAVVILCLGTCLWRHADMVVRECLTPDIPLPTCIRTVGSSSWVATSTGLAIIIGCLISCCWCHTDMIIGPSHAPDIPLNTRTHLIAYRRIARIVYRRIARIAYRRIARIASHL